MLDTPEVRAVSEAVFRNGYALEVLASIASENGAFYAAELGQRLGIQPNLVTPTLERLVGCGMLKELPRRGRRGIRYFERQRPESALWRLSEEFASELE